MYERFILLIVLNWNDMANFMYKKVKVFLYSNDLVVKVMAYLQIETFYVFQMYF